MAKLLPFLITLSLFVTSSAFGQVEQPIDCRALLAEPESYVRSWESEMLARQIPFFTQLPASERLRVSRDVIMAGEAKIADVQRIKNRLVARYINRDGATYLKLLEPSKSPSLPGFDNATYLPQDAKTGAIDANDVAGRRLVTSLVEESDRGVALIFIDVNNLGRVNYFRAGQLAGDQYLEAVAVAVRRNLRPDDLIFKTGGDELVVILDTQDPNVVKEVAKRMVHSVSFSTEAKRAFREQSKYLAALFRQVRNASSFEELGPEVRGQMSVEDADLAKHNFSEFQSQYLTSLQGQIEEHRKYQPSIAIGQSMTSPGVKFDVAKQVAEQEAALVKIEFKITMGQDVSKYQHASGGPSVDRRRDPFVTLPLVRDPVNVRIQE